MIRRFDPRRWLGMAVIVWLATVGGGGAKLNLPGPAGPGVSLPVVDERWAEAMSWVSLAYAVVVLVGMFVVVTWVLTTWVNSRAAFVFVDAVATGQARLRPAWRRYARPGGSLFWFRLVTGTATALLLVAPLTAGCVWLAIWASLDRGTELLAPVGLALALAWGAGAFTLVTAHKALRAVVDDLVVPVMYARVTGFWSALGELGRLTARRPGAFVGYALLRVSVGAVAAVGLGLAGLSCVLGAVPMLDVLLLLPVWVTLRALALCFLAEVGGLTGLRRW